jgi:nitrite reductase (NADH) large subunit
MKDIMTNENPTDSGRIIIIGGGIAGVTAAEAARTHSPGVEIVLVHEEPGLPYSRLNLTRLIAGETESEKLDLNNSTWYVDNRIKLIHDQVTAIHLGKKYVVMRGSGELQYCHLILAMGADPFVPLIPGTSLKCVSTLRTLAQAREIIDRVREGTKCVCMGGGLLGIELAVGLKKRGAAVTILEGFGWLLPKQLAPPASAILKKHIEEMGLTVLCGVKVARLIGNDTVSGVVFENGGSLEAEMVLISIGVRPNVKMAASSGLAVAKGVTVDDRMATSDASIYAAGDVTEHNGVVYGLWSAAMEQGRVAGVNAVGGSEEFKGMPMSAFLKVVGIDMFSIGKFMPEDDDTIIFESEHGGKYVRLAIRNGVVIGCNLLGDIGAAQLVKRAIETKNPVSQNSKLVSRFPGLLEAMSNTKE